VVGQPLDVLAQPVRIAAFDGADDAGVQDLAAIGTRGTEAEQSYMTQRVVLYEAVSCRVDRRALAEPHSPRAAWSPGHPPC
jgi:hypothetical protein